MGQANDRDRQEKARTAVQRVQRTNQRLKEKHDPGAALQDALADYDEHSEECRHGNDPDTCKICEDKRRLFRLAPVDEGLHRSHVHHTWS